MLSSEGFFLMNDGTKSTEPQHANLIKMKKTTKSDAEEESLPEDLQPKRAMTAFLYFNIEFSTEIRARDPTKILAVTEVSKMVSDKWTTMSEEQKAPFDKKNLSDKMRLKKQIEELRTQGYFTLADGTKSTDA